MRDDCSSVVYYNDKKYIIYIQSDVRDRFFLFYNIIFHFMRESRYFSTMDKLPLPALSNLFAIYKGGGGITLLHIFS